MKQNWEKLVRRVDNISLRERALIFLALAAALIAVIKPVFFDPLLKQQREIAAQVDKREQSLHEVQERISAVTLAKQNDMNSPQRRHLAQLKQQLEDGNAYFQSIRDKLVEPEEVATMLKRVLDENGRLELVELKTLPVTPLLEGNASDAASGLDKQVFKHGITLTIRGNYLDLLQYLTTLKELQAQLFWTDAKMSANYPVTELTLTLYTLSLDKTWLQI
jgi:MSHA biogenesis protein MshJ